MTDPSPPSPPAQPSPPNLLPADAEGFVRVDPRTLTLAKISDVIGFVVLSAIVLVGGAIAAANFDGLWPWLIAALAGIAAISLWSIFWYEPRAYRIFGYRIDEKVLLIREGVFWRTLKLLPLSRIQHVDVKRGPLQRKLGLATLVLYTAGTQASSIEIPGLEAGLAVQLRDHLVAVGGDDAV